MGDDHKPDFRSPEAISSRRIFIGIIILFAVAGFLMYAEHRVHILGLGLWLLLLACPLLHLFMHGGHGGHGDHADRGQPRERPTERNSLGRREGEAP